VDDVVLFMKLKKGQIQMTETVAVLFIFFVLLIFGMIFYYKYVGFSLKEEQQAAVERRAAEVVTKTIFLPEIQCTTGNLQQKVYCLDVMKMNVLPTVMSEHLEDYYFSIFSFATVTVEELYPLSEGGKERVWRSTIIPRKILLRRSKVPFMSCYAMISCVGLLGG